jgi:cell division protein FtsB
MHNVVHNSKIETAELCSTFGKLANDWHETVKKINAMHDEQRKDYERRIEALEKTNEQLAKENEEMKKAIEDFKKMELEFEQQKRIFRLGQIAFKLEALVSEYVFPGEDKASKRARYGTNLKSLKGKIDKLKDSKLQEGARSRLQGLNEEMFEDWFLGIVKELKNLRLDSAHPNLGTYEELKSMITEEFGDEHKREDMLEALERLQEMYTKMERNFGE